MRLHSFSSSALVLSLLALNTACSSSGNGASADPGEAGSLFDAPAGTTTPDRVTGLWGGALDEGGVHFDFRIRLEEARMTVASRCKWSDALVLTVGASASSRTAQKPDGDLSCFPLEGVDGKRECGDVELLESKSDRADSGDRWCAVDLHPEAYPWTMSGTRLRFTISGRQIDLVKISD